MTQLTAGLSCIRFICSAMSNLRERMIKNVLSVLMFGDEETGELFEVCWPRA